MAIGGGEQLNQNLEFLLKHFGQLGLMKKRQEAESSLIDQRMAGYSQLEEERQANRMTQIQEAFLNNIAKDPAVERKTALIFKKRMKGEEVPQSMLDDLRKVVKERSMLAHHVSTGTILPPDKEYLFDNISESAVVHLAGQGATTERAKMVAGPARMREARLLLGMTDESAEKQRTRWIDFVKDTVNFLETEGVKGDSIGFDIRSLFSSGKVTDPLSSKNRGKAFSYLAEIWTKLIQNKKLTPGDIKFLLNVRDVRSIETPVEEGGFGGLPEPALGGESQAQVTTGMIEQIAKDIQTRTKVDYQTALELAKEFYGSKIK